MDQASLRHIGECLELSTAALGEGDRFRQHSHNNWVPLRSAVLLFLFFIKLQGHRYGCYQGLMSAIAEYASWRWFSAEILDMVM